MEVTINGSLSKPQMSLFLLQEEMRERLRFWRASNQFVCNQDISQGKETSSKASMNTLYDGSSLAPLKIRHISGT